MAEQQRNHDGDSYECPAPKVRRECDSSLGYVANAIIALGICLICAVIGWQLAFVVSQGMQGVMALGAAAAVGGIITLACKPGKRIN